MPSEFDIIRQYFTLKQNRSDVILGVGDDAAILDISKHPQQQLVQSTDTLIAGVHFPEDTSAQDIAYKALAVNLSDMAAMGAEPAWFTLAITLPDDNPEWLKAFSESLAAISAKYNLQLIGGDTTRGAFLSLSITISGFVAENKALTRSKAKVGDSVYVSGTLGDAALALAAWRKECLIANEYSEYLYQRLNRPTPQVELGLLLRDYATSCIDVSDGLIADLGHITEQSAVGASVVFENIPLSEAFNSSLTDNALKAPLVLAGGDDYELCFTVSKSKQDKFNQLIKEKNLLVTCIGEIESHTGVRCSLNNQDIDILEPGYNHFEN